MRWERRRRARRLLVQALYQQQLAGDGPGEIEAQFSRRADYRKADIAFFSELLVEICHRTSELDQEIAGASDIPPERIDPVERAILWSALAELQTTGAQSAVVINEAIELSREFGAEQGYRFVNAVLDRWVKARLPNKETSNSNGNA